MQSKNRQKPGKQRAPPLRTEKWSLRKSLLAAGSNIPYGGDGKPSNNFGQPYACVCILSRDRDPRVAYWGPHTVLSIHGVTEPQSSVRETRQECGDLNVLSRLDRLVRVVTFRLTGLIQPLVQRVEQFARGTRKFTYGRHSLIMCCIVPTLIGCRVYDSHKNQLRKSEKK